MAICILVFNIKLLLRNKEYMAVREDVRYSGIRKDAFLIDNQDLLDMFIVLSSDVRSMISSSSLVSS